MIKQSSVILVFLMLILSQSAKSQQDFQQEVNHIIEVRLDIEAKALIGQIETEYINKSPNSLDFIYYHLWPNAYKNNNTAFAKQKLEYGDTEFYFASDDRKGYIDSLSFTVNGISAETKNTPFGIDVIVLILPKTLLPGDTVKIKTDFYVKLPNVFSRLGYDDNTFCITQWYPKPAVYDKNGWHPMSYLDMGEFYSEFGNFDVQITLPDNYIVAATGNLWSKSELQRLEDYAEICKKSKYLENIAAYGDSTKLKTVRYVEKHVHDFAWFASTDFAVGRENVKLDDSDKTIFCWTFYKKNHAQIWKTAINYVKQSVNFFSSEIGAYPYANCTAVDGPISAGGGMEYPTITVVTGSSASSLENVIMHEVGHNWFYGILASNERADPWIDEGFTSFYESKYNDKFHPNTGLIEQLIDVKMAKSALEEIPGRYLRELSWLYLLRENQAQSSALSSEEMSATNYVIMAYSKPVTVLYALEKYLGPDKFKSIMKDFFQTYKFQHIYSDSFAEFFKSETGNPITDKFFIDLMIDNKMPDYKIAGRRGDSLLIKNKRESAIPLLLYFGDSLVIDDGFVGKKKFYLPQKIEVSIDKDFYSPDFNRNNNYYRPGFLKSNKPIKLKIGNFLDNPKICEIPFLPVIAFNTADGWMPGLMLYSSPFPKKKFEYQIAPLYGIRSGNLAGIANFSYYIHPKSKIIREYELFTKLASFGTDSASCRIKISYGVIAKLITDPTSRQDATICLRQVSATDFYSGKLKHFQSIESSFSDNRKINPWSFKLNGEMSEGYGKVWGEIKQTITYSEKLKGLTIRLFAGKFLYNSPEYYGNYNFRLSGNLGSQDYLYDEMFVGRAEDIRYSPESFWSHQFLRNDGGFTLYTPYGQSNNWLASLNLDSSTPLPFLDLYFNLGACPSISNDKFADTYYEAGLKIKIWEDFLCVYLPVTGSTVIWKASNDIYTDNYFQKIRFTLSLSKINLLNYREKPYLLF